VSDQGRALRTTLRVENLADAPVVRAVTLRRGLSAGLGRLRASEAALVASELATNIVKYGCGGEIELDVDLQALTFSIVALDRGPGLPSLEDYFKDGVSRGTPRAPDSPLVSGLGSGGGAVRRLADEVTWEPRAGGGSKISCIIALESGQGPAGISKGREKLS